MDITYTITGIYGPFSGLAVSPHTMAQLHTMRERSDTTQHRLLSCSQQPTAAPSTKTPTLEGVMCLHVMLIMFYVAGYRKARPFGGLSKPAAYTA